MKIAFIGRPKITADEQAKLELLGIVLQRAGRQLYTVDMGDANKAVARGYESAGGEPIFQSKNLVTDTDATIAFVDDVLEHRLRAAPASANAIAFLRTSADLTTFVDHAIRLTAITTSV